VPVQNNERIFAAALGICLTPLKSGHLALGELVLITAVPNQGLMAEPSYVI